MKINLTNWSRVLKSYAEKKKNRKKCKFKMFKDIKNLIDIIR